MMSITSIRQVSRDAAIRAARDNRIPFTVEPQDLADWKAQLQSGKFLRLPFPFLGDYLPQGWRYTDRPPLFVDTSGVGRENEPALTLRRFLETIEPNKAYAVVQSGQFQAHVREYERDDSSVGNVDDFVGLTSAEEQEFKDAFSESLKADVEIRWECSIALFEPLTARAAVWIAERVKEPLYFGLALVVEHRYASALAAAMKADGLRLA